MTALATEFLEAQKRRNVWPIVGQNVDVYWELVWGLFRNIPHWLHLYDEAWTYQHVKKGHLHVWAYADSEIRGILVTRINVFPKCKVLDVVGMSGIAGIEFLDDLDSICETLARQNDCTFLTCQARPGMERLLLRKHRAAKALTTLVRPVGLLRSS